MSKVIRPDNEGAIVIPEEHDYEEAAEDGIWHPICPYCGLPTPAEPDADSVVCINCDARFRIRSIV